MGLAYALFRTIIGYQVCKPFSCLERLDFFIPKIAHQWYHNSLKDICVWLKTVSDFYGNCNGNNAATLLWFLHFIHPFHCLARNLLATVIQKNSGKRERGYFDTAWQV